MTLFDTHAHIVTGDTAAYPPAPISGRVREGALDDPMTAERLLAVMDAEGVGRAALVQRAHIYGYDNRYVIDAARRWPERFAAIAVIDSTAADAAVQAARWLDAGAAGIRLTEPAKGADGDWLGGERARAVWEVVAHAGATLSVQLYTWNRADRLLEIPPLARQFAQVPVIVEHLSNLAESDAAPDFGVDAALDALAPLANVHLKLTTINLARASAGKIDTRPLVGRVASAFPDRLMWGSDVAQSPQPYAAMVALARAAVAGLPAAAQAAVLGGTAAALFGP
jgi:predicted TIM-barrel fold metal-dependent hydrolase